MLTKQQTQSFEEEGILSNLLTLILLLALMGTLGAVLYLASGPPHLPRPIPSWDEISGVLQSSELPPGVFNYIVGMAGWLFLAYLTVTILLRMIVDLVAAIIRENPLVRGLQAVSDGLTIPLVRKLIDGVLVAVTVAHLLGPDLGPSPVAAAPMTVARMVPRPGGVAPGHAHAAPVQPASRPNRADARKSIHYLVKRGGTLRVIAARFLGDETQWQRIWEANRGHRMDDGTIFSNPDLIEPSWELTIPVGDQPAHAVYVVQPGDALWSIAERELGNGLKWREIWELNEGRVMPGGLPFTDPRLLEPGWQLLLPKPPAHPASQQIPHTAPVPNAKPAAPAQNHRPAPPIAPLPPASPPPAPIQPTLPIPTPSPVPPTATPQPVPATPKPVHKEFPVLTLPDGRVIAATFGAALLGLLAYLVRGRLLAAMTTTAAAVEPDRGPIPGRFLALLRQRFGAELETDKVAIVANRLWVVLGTVGEHSAMVVSCLEGRKSVILTFQCSHDRAQPSRLLDLAPTLAEELEARVRAEQTGRDEVVLTVSGLSYRSMLASIQPGYFHYLPLLCPLGATDDGRLFHLNLDAARALLIASVPGGGADELLRTVLVTIAAQAHPRQVQLALLGDPRGALALLDKLPHLQGSLVDRDEPVAVLGLLESLQAELARRIAVCQKQKEGNIEEYNDFREGSSDLMPYLIVAIDGLESALHHADVAGLLGTLCQEGPRYGISVLATTLASATLPEPLLDAFPTRIALRLVDEGQSLRVLGCPGAENLDPDGELLLKLTGHPAQRLRGLRIEPDEIGECVALMAAALGESVIGSAGCPERPAGIDDVPGPSEMVGESNHHGGEEKSEIGTTRVLRASDAVAEVNESLMATPLDRSATPEIVEEIPGSDRDERVQMTMQEYSARGDDLVCVSCFGGFHVYKGGIDLAGPNSRGSAGRGTGKPPFVAKSRELLAYFVTYPHLELARERIQEKLWPNDAPESAKKSFDNTLYRVRHGLNGDADGGHSQRYIAQQDGSYELQSERFWIDAVEFERLLKRAEAAEASAPDEAARLRQQATELYRGDYLDHCFYEWAEAEQTRLRNLYLRTLAKLADYQTGRGELNGAVELLQRAVEIDPFNESLHRRLLQLHARASNWPTVVHHYENLTAMLHREINAAPDRRTQELYHRLLDRRDSRVEQHVTPS